MASVKRELAKNIADALVECTNQDTLRWLLNIQQGELSLLETTAVNTLLHRASVHTHTHTHTESLTHSLTSSGSPACR